MKLGNSGGELSDGELLAFDCCCLHVNKRIFGFGGMVRLSRALMRSVRALEAVVCMNPKGRILVGCHVMHFSMDCEFLGPEVFPRVPGFLVDEKSLPLLVCIIEHANGDSMFDPSVDHCFSADGDFCISSK